MSEYDDVRTLFFDLFRDLPCLGPGSDDITLERLMRVPASHRDGLVVDMGCGLGRTTLLIAAHTSARLVGIDTHLPYLRELHGRAVARGWGGRLDVAAADMGRPPIAPGTVDVVWAEGSIYLVGLAEGLRTWRPLLTDGGWVAFTDVAWLTPDPPERARRFWTEYPGMTSVEEQLAVIRAEGFLPEDPVVLPAAAWEDYYQPLEARLAGFLDRHPGSSAAAEVAAAVREEIDTFRATTGSYSYVFHLARRG